jgi:methionyl aminopeptidase
MVAVNAAAMSQGASRLLFAADRPPLRQRPCGRLERYTATRMQKGDAIMVEIKNPEQIAKMRAAGLVVAAIHEATREAAVPGASTKDLDEVAAKVIADHGAKPNFLGYGGFPGNICTSVNDVVVHGIPDRETVLKDGDIISIDAGAIIDGWHGDAAFTAFVGSGHAPELLELSQVTEESMWAGIAAFRNGNRLVDISKAIESYIRRQPRPATGKYGIIEDYGGHGIGTEMHMDPHLLNYVSRKRGRGIKLVPGVCLAIEPMVSLGTPHTHVLEDNWTVKTDDGSWSSHWEHSIALTEQGPLVLTAVDGGKAKLAEYGITAAPDPLG